MVDLDDSENAVEIMDNIIIVPNDGSESSFNDNITGESMIDEVDQNKRKQISISAAFRTADEISGADSENVILCGEERDVECITLPTLKGRLRGRSVKKN